MKVGTDGVLLGAYADCSGAKRILDIGTGSGLLCLMLAQKSDAIIHGIDINSEAVEVARANVAESKWSDRIEIYCVAVQDFKPAEKYNIIISNPPFYSTDVVAPVRGRAMARHDICLDSDELLLSIDRLLADDGRCYVIYPVNQAEMFVSTAEEKGLYVLRKLYVSSRMGSEPIRMIVELGRQKCETQTEFLSIENNARHNFSDEYIKLTRDYYLKF